MKDTGTAAKVIMVTPTIRSKQILSLAIHYICACLFTSYRYLGVELTSVMPSKESNKKMGKYRAYSRSKVDVATDRKEYFHDYYIEM